MLGFKRRESVFANALPRLKKRKLVPFYFFFFFFISGYNLEILLCFKLQICSTLNSILISIANWLFVVKYVYEDR